jgi:lactoylglutathione lyase
MSERAFPVVFAREVQRSAAFYQALGFERHFQLPDDGEPGYVGLRRGSYELAVVSADWPQQQYGRSVAAGVRFEMFTYVESVDAVVTRLRDTETTILRTPQDMPWGERVAYVTDPDGTPSGSLRAPTAQAEFDVSHPKQ